MFYGRSSRNLTPGDMGKFVKRDSCYRTKRYEFDLETCTATSYGWWLFVIRIGNVIYFNDSTYSRETNIHQIMARNVLNNSDLKRLGLNMRLKP